MIDAVRLVYLSGIFLFILKHPSVTFHIKSSVDLDVMYYINNNFPGFFDFRHAVFFQYNLEDVNFQGIVYQMNSSLALPEKLYPDISSYVAIFTEIVSSTLVYKILKCQNTLSI